MIVLNGFEQLCVAVIALLLAAVAGLLIIACVPERSLWLPTFRD